MIALLEAHRAGILPRNVMVYRIEGPFYFGAADKLERTLDEAGITSLVGAENLCDGMNTVTERAASPAV